MPTTTRLAIPYPAGTDAPNGPAQLQALANALDNAAIDLTEGTLASRPAASLRGRWYYATDVGILYRDSGSTWRSLVQMLGTDGLTASHIAADAIGTSELGPLAVTNAEVSASAAIAESKLSLASDAAAGTASRRTLGTGATQAAAGNDARFTDQRVPTDGSVTLAKLATAVSDLLWKTGDYKHVAYDVTAGAEPTGWLLCDGRAVSRGGANAALFAKIGTQHGVGDGSTTFNLPDARGRAIVGKGSHADVNTIGLTDGDAVASRTPKHSHTVASHSHTVNSHTHLVPSPIGMNSGFAVVLAMTSVPGGVLQQQLTLLGSNMGALDPPVQASQTHERWRITSEASSPGTSTSSPGTDTKSSPYVVGSVLVKL